MEGLVYLIVGLGNPGRQYRENRHNIGFLLVDRLAVRLNLAFSRLQFHALVASGEYAGHKIILAKPQTFMNLSGKAVSALIRFYKIPMEQLMTVYDDLDLPFGAIRLRPGGGSAGHQGMVSIIDRLGTQEFARLRMGIGRPPGRMEAADFVLKDFPEGDWIQLSEVLEHAASSALLWMSDGLEAAMNQFNTKGVGRDEE